MSLTLRRQRGLKPKSKKWGLKPKSRANAKMYFVPAENLRGGGLCCKQDQDWGNKNIASK